MAWCPQLDSCPQLDLSCGRAQNALMTSRSGHRVPLAPDLARVVRNRLRSGKYRTADDVLREDLRLLVARDRKPVESIGELKREIAFGLTQLRRGEFVESAVIFRRLRARSRSRAAARS